jgi:hypothetical protein
VRLPADLQSGAKGVEVYSQGVQLQNLRKTCYTFIECRKSCIYLMIATSYLYLMKATQESINIENQHTENINWEEKKRNFNN